MKKGKTLLAALFLFSSVILSPIGNFVNAEEISQDIPTESEVSSESVAPAETADSTEPEAPVESEASTEPEEPVESQTSTEPELPAEPNSSTEPEAPVETEASTEPEAPAETETPTEQANIESVRAQLRALIDEAKTYLDYTRYNNDILYYLENYIINAEAALADTNSTATLLQNHITVLTTALNYVKDPANARTEDTEVTINVSDHTMNIGDVITPELVLGWATVENGDNLYLEAEVIGRPIMIDSITNQLVEAGTYTIRYTVRSVDPAGNPLMTRSIGVEPQMAVISKDITLTVVDPNAGGPEKPTNPDDSVAPTDTQKPLDTSKSGDGSNSNQLLSMNNPVVGDAKVNAANPTDKKLPQTGEENATMVVAFGGVMLAVGAYLLKRRQIKNT
jgi:LPXTG-motif cell wall-anchored protein